MLLVGLLAIVVGTAIGFATGDSHISTEGVGLYPPIPVLGDLLARLGREGERASPGGEPAA